MQILYWILAIVISLAIGYWVYRADQRRAVPYPWLTAALRVMVIFLTCLLLLAPTLSINKNETQKPLLVFLQDNSQSVPVALKQDTAQYKKDASRLLSQLEEDYRVVKWGFGSGIQRDTLFEYQQASTDISQALSQAIDFYGQQNLGAVILATDGRYNQGANPQFSDLPFQGTVYTVALGDSAVQKDIRISNVYTNKTVTLNSQFEIRADLVAQRVSGYNNNIRLSDGTDGTALTQPLNVTSDRYDRSVSFTVKADRAGLHHYTISVPPADGEQNTANNRRDIFVEVVREQKKVLIAANAPHPDVNAIREALAGLDGFEVVVKTGDNLPSSFADYQVVILHSLPSQNNLVQQLAGSRKAVWLIMGANSNSAAYNNVQTLARLNVNPFNLQNQFAAFNTAFTSFTLPQNTQAVLDKMPPLAVPAGSVQTNPNTLVVFSARGNNTLPLWMLQQGAAPAALLVGEGLWRWRLAEYRHFNSHQVVDEAIRQTVSFLAANVNDRPFRVELPKYVWSDQEGISMNAYLLNANNEQVNTSIATLTLTDSAGKKQNYNFEKSGSAYKLQLGLRAAGTYSYAATTNYNGVKYEATGSFLVQHLPIEMMETGANYPLLYSISQQYGGALVPANNVLSLYDSIRKNPNIKPLIQSTTETIPLVDWKWYFFLLLLFATAEWLLRKYWLAQ